MAATHHSYGLTGNGDLQGTAEALTGRHGVENFVYVFERVRVTTRDVMLSRTV